MEGLGHRSSRTVTSSHVRHVTSPRVAARPRKGGLTKSSSDHNLNSSSDNTTLLTFNSLNAEDLLDSTALAPGHSHSNCRFQSNSHSQKTRTQKKSVDMETFEDLLKQATFEASQETEPVLLSPSTAQTSDLSHISVESSSGQLSPPQKQTAAQSQSELTAQVELIERENSETLHEQLARKKTAMAMSRDQAKEELASLDPEQW